MVGGVQGTRRRGEEQEEEKQQGRQTVDKRGAMVALGEHLMHLLHLVISRPVL